jgi:DNA ligase (NAD+)
LQTVEGIGPIVAKAIAEWVERPQNQGIVARLVAAGINPRQEPTSAADAGPLEGLTLVVTGRLDTMSRNEAEDRIRDLGGKVGSAVSKGTTALVVGAEAGTKLAKAEKLGVRTLDEGQFVRLLEEGPAVLGESALSGVK